MLTKRKSVLLKWSVILRNPNGIKSKTSGNWEVLWDTMSGTTKHFEVLQVQKTLILDFKVQRIPSCRKKGEQVFSWRWTKNSCLKNWKNGKVLSWSLHISRDEELSETARRFPVTYDKFQGFKEKYAVNNAWDGVATVLGFIQTDNNFYFNFFISFFETRIHLA